MISAIIFVGVYIVGKHVKQPESHTSAQAFSLFSWEKARIATIVGGCGLNQGVGMPLR